MTGCYILVTYIPDKLDICIGSLGKLQFNKGYYLYVGSAMGDFGSSTLINRVKRHVRPAKEKKTHWHIDYLLNQKSNIITRLYLIPSIERLECIIATDLKKISDDYIKNFGSSDCNCPSHLLYFKDFKEINYLSNLEKNDNKHS
ncbi:MAG: GIY-YIG nuclease family protein [Promethearchaeota archaeon]|jgi:Uri superfamily endonuclease